MRPWRDLDAERRLRRACESDRVGDCAVARGSADKFDRAVEGRAFHELFYALVDVAQTLFEPHDRLAAGGEAEMSGFDDAGVDRTHRDLMQALAFGRKERVRLARVGAWLRRHVEGIRQTP